MQQTQIGKLTSSRAQPKEERALILIVDDDARIREALHELILSAGMQPACFASTRELLDAEVLDQPGCLILDVRMPGTSGLDLQHQLATRGNHKPIIFLTGYGDIPMTVQAMKSGAVEFLMKPFRPQELLDAVQHALDGDQKSRERRRKSEEVRRRYETLTRASAR